MNDLQQIRDELLFIADGCLVPPDGGSPDIYDAMASAKRALIALDHMIETPAPQGCVDDQPKCTWDFYRSTLERFVHETTHLSPQNDDGSHDCKISKKCLLHGRIALELLGKLSAAPTPSSTEKVDLDALRRESLEACLFDSIDSFGLSDRNIWDTHQIYEGASRMFDNLVPYIASKGYIVVPEEPTEDMIEDACLSTIDLHPEQAKLIYKSMLANTGRLR